MSCGNASVGIDTSISTKRPRKKIEKEAGKKCKQSVVIIGKFAFVNQC